MLEDLPKLLKKNFKFEDLYNLNIKLRKISEISASVADILDLPRKLQKKNFKFENLCS